MFSLIRKLRYWFKYRKKPNLKPTFVTPLIFPKFLVTKQDREFIELQKRSKGIKMNQLTERRSEFVYNAARLAAISAKTPIIPVVWVEREQAFKDQFLKVIERQCGGSRSRSPEELHGSWMQAYFAMGWIHGEEYSKNNRIHPDLVPYAELGQLERDKDAVFIALCEIARQWIYNTDKGKKK